MCVVPDRKFLEQPTMEYLHLSQILLNLALSISGKMAWMLLLRCSLTGSSHFELACKGRMSHPVECEAPTQGANLIPALLVNKFTSISPTNTKLGSDVKGGQDSSDGF